MLRGGVAQGVGDRGDCLSRLGKEEQSPFHPGLGAFLKKSLSIEFFEETLRLPDT